ncbi:MAG: molybdopterin cofactor-binding domain-containing protein [Steroidobacter sp.]
MSTSLSRRSFLVASGGLSIVLLADGVIKVASASEAPPAGHALNAWVTIGVDGIVTIKSGSAELGQGVITALPLIAAEEMDADWSKVRVELVTHDAKTHGNPKIFGMLYTAGSTSVEAYFDTLRRAGAAARRVLIHSAARHWKVAPSRLEAANGTVTHAASGRKLTFGEIAALPLIGDVPAIKDSDLKPRTAYRLIGHDVDRPDVPAKTRGAQTYTIDMHVPNMLHAAVWRAPVEGESAATIDDAAAKAMKGVVAISKLPEGVAVLAERWETALMARAALKVEWTRQSEFRSANSAETLQADMKAAHEVERRGAVWHERGTALNNIAAAERVITGEYATDHVYHAQMEPLAAVASVGPDGKTAEVWVGTQAPSVVLMVATQVLGTTPDKIRVNLLQMGGGFGRRTMFTRELLRDALLLSKQVHRPVKVLWTREDDVRNGWFRPATAQVLRATLGGDGRIQAWNHRVACASVMGYYSAENLERAKNRDLFVMEGSELSEYEVPHLLAEHVITPRRARIAAWRGIGAGHNEFASECFIDELAAAVAANPIEFRRRHLRHNARATAVLDRVVAMSSFGKAPAGRAHGISLAPYKTSVAAGVAEISVDRATGALRVHRFWAAVDPGLVIQPRNLIAQVEGGILWGLSGLLKERITIEHGEVQQSNYHDYQFLRMSDAPEVQVEIVTSSAPPSGAGELGVPMTGGAVANALFALTGKRIRHMPFTPDRVRSLLA